MRTFGRFYIQNNHIIIDAEPFVMSKIRGFFPTRISYRDGNYTSRQVGLSPTLSNCRDMLWLLSRFPLKATKDDLEYITTKANDYDRLLLDVAKPNIKDYSDDDREFKLTVNLRQHQKEFNVLAKKAKKLLLGDKMGLGKTISSLSLIDNKDRLPVIILMPPTLCPQWEGVIKEVIPDLKTHLIKGLKKYDLPQADVYITSYNRVGAHFDQLEMLHPQLLIMDEVHDLRHTGTNKRDAAKALSSKVPMVVGLSGTPIINYGGEIWSIIDVISDNALGSRYDFIGEWCDTYTESVQTPDVLHNYLTSQGLMLRRSVKDTGLDFGLINKQVVKIESSLEDLKAIENVAKTLALSVLGSDINEAAESSREFDWKLRQATGIAKAKSVAEFCKMLLEEEKKILITVWHRGVIDILQRELQSFLPVMITGSESPAQKEKSKDDFINGESRVLMISLRSGAGIDGLQKVCSTIVHAELDWSPHIMDQLNDRLHRDGQTELVNAYYPVIPDGSDPVLIQMQNLKREQHEGLIEGKKQGDYTQTQASPDRIKDLAKKYLESIGEEVPEIIEEKGLLKDISEAIRNSRLPHDNEESMQLALEKVLTEALPHATVEREVKISKRSRVDFMVTGDIKVAIECKITARKRQEVYRQVRRYVEEAGAQAVVIVAPWYGIKSFSIDGVPVVVIETASSAL